MVKREVDNLLPLLPEEIKKQLRRLGLSGLYFKYDGVIFITLKSGLSVDASKVEDQEIYRLIKKSANRLKNIERNNITNTLQRYYNTKDLKKMLLLEKEIDNLEHIFYNRFAWYVIRDWEKERNRN